MSSAASAYMLAADQKRRSMSTVPILVQNATPKSSFESARSTENSQQNAFKRAAKKVVKAAKEHHQSVNAAFDAYYGVNSQQKPPVRWE